LAFKNSYRAQPACHGHSLDLPLRFSSTGI
jgi:hypothetical protein